jgi:hypothetical protein
MRIDRLDRDLGIRKIRSIYGTMSEIDTVSIGQQPLFQRCGNSADTRPHLDPFDLQT